MAGWSARQICSTKRTIKPHEAVTTVDTASEALAVSISEKACVDMAYMEQLTGKTGEELADELRGVIFRVPGQTEPDGTPHYVTADEYLSGNVRRKLRQAQRAAEQDPAFAVNVEALTAAQPKDLDASEIEVRLGATWIDKEYIQQFMYETFDTPFYLQRSIEVHYTPLRRNGRSPAKMSWGKTTWPPIRPTGPAAPTPIKSSKIPSICGMCVSTTPWRTRTARNAGC